MEADNEVNCKLFYYEKDLDLAEKRYKESYKFILAYPWKLFTRPVTSKGCIRKYIILLPL